MGYGANRVPQIELGYEPSRRAHAFIGGVARCIRYREGTRIELSDQRFHVSMRCGVAWGASAACWLFCTVLLRRRS